MDRMQQLRALYERGLPGGLSAPDASGTFHVDTSLGLASELSLGAGQPEPDEAQAEGQAEDQPEGQPEPQADETPHDEPALAARSPSPRGVDDIDASLSDSLRATQAPDVNELLEDEDITPERSVSGQWGVREMRRRTAAGVSARSAQQKIDQLTAERDDLKIEVDFHRRKMAPDDVSAELIALRQEKLSYVRRLQKLNELVKRQDQALKAVNEQVKRWELRVQDYDALSGALAAAEARAAAAEAAAPPADVAALERELADVHAALADAEHALSAPAEADASLQRQVDEQHETICALQDALAAERLAAAAKDGELDRVEGELDALHGDAALELEALRRDADAHRDAAARAHAQLDALHGDVARLEHALREAHTYHEGLNQALKDRLSRSAAGADDEQRRLSAERDAAQAALDTQAARVADLEELNARLNDKVHELVADLRDEEAARERAADDAARRAAERDAQPAASPAAASADAEARLAALEDELAARDEHVAALEADAARLRAETRELAAALHDATHARLGLEDRLDAALARVERDDAPPPAARPAPAPPVDRSAERAAQRAAAAHASLLGTLHDALARALGEPARHADVASSAFPERMHALVRRLAGMHASFEARVHELERHADAETSALRRQQEQRLAQLERVEKTMRTAAEKQAQWRRRVADHDGELHALQRANAALQQQLARLRAGGASGAHVDDGAWAARLRELEARVREADERVRRERAGARERAAHDDARIRELQALVAQRDA